MVVIQNTVLTRTNELMEAAKGEFDRNKVRSAMRGFAYVHRSTLIKSSPTPKEVFCPKCHPLLHSNKTASLTIKGNIFFLIYFPRLNQLWHLMHFGCSHLFIKLLRDHLARFWKLPFCNFSYSILFACEILIKPLISRKTHCTIDHLVLKSKST